MKLKESKGSFTYNICLKKTRNSSLPYPFLIKNTKEIRLCQNHPLPFLADIICKQSLKVVRIYYKYVKVE